MVYLNNPLCRNGERMPKKLEKLTKTGNPGA